jgi:hypothetical protein
MAKKPSAPKKPAPDCTKQLIDAIVTVKNLQDFIQSHGGVEKAIEAVARVRSMIELTGGFEPLNQALAIVGGQAAEPQG